ncbi:two-component sensor histidine kinase [Malaciobacter pacificus]|uniref:histidine kinase n=1 Tax=Malaciobacter pacificus TaxID=1080223 RepID=A0A5C2H318_9BACT|nr:ATP-binding protein [Malaciobacter pacificus]QEP33350.1 two-component system sensor histidine kinase [Malaciobacter pacificus]GGD30705.1 two-component sensor histidine kinase [Malaciobacter pacificus]
MLKIHQLFFRTFSLIFLAILITLSFITYYWSKNIYINQIEKNLIQNIDTLSVVLKDLNNIENIIKDLKANINLRITLIDEKGNIIAESDKDKETMENHSNREEILMAKDKGIGKSLRFSSSIKKELLYVAKKITIDRKIYFIRMADYTDKITDNFVKLTLQIFMFITFFLILAFLATYFISLRIKHETDNILNFLTHISNKRTPYRLKSNYTDEFYKITKLLNKVAFKLAKKNRQKAKQTAKLKIANKQKDEIISAISHEFKNPIAVISGYSETILNDEDLPKIMKDKFLTKIQSNSQKMSNIIDKLRLTLKLEEGKQELILTPTSIKNIVNQAVCDLKDKYKNREILIEGEDITLKVDETLISMAITNLIENALKYSDDEVTITISQNELCVKDKGIGIEPKELENINQKFYRVSKNGWNNSLGLGLFIVQSILTLHNFQLKVDSTFEKGSSFCIKY